ncbi:beta strand repeat-containing protein [Allokutzneria oryzae]|uniref:Beta strand repeat-containing protein n=1 Tax=Allokutzneria oryzae TaxID=1378989 RepID=A0ABV6A0G1_9PSEU
MHSWAKRGMKAALLTGGMFIIGAGIAQAGEAQVNPDAPTTPLGGKISIPVNIDNNAAGLPIVGQMDLPSFKRDVTVDVSSLVGGLPGGEGEKATAKKADKKAYGPNKKASKDAGSVQDPFRDNKVDADLIVPVDISGNAVAAGGNVEVENESSYSSSNPEVMVADGTHQGLAGNVVDVDALAPIQLTGNAVAAVGSATTWNTSSTDVQSGGSAVTSGEEGSLSGNVVKPAIALPIQGSGNAISGLAGVAEANNQSDISADASGDVCTTGEDGTLSGNIGHAPVALPVELNNNALAALVGTSDTNGTTSATAVANGDRDTNGLDSLGGGNVIQPGLGADALVSGNSLNWIGNTDADSATETYSEAAGTTHTTGSESLGAGNVIDAPLAPSAQVIAAAGGFITNADAYHEQSTFTGAGGNSYTLGDDSLASGLVPSAPVALPASVAALSGGLVANTDAQAVDEGTHGASGFVGTRGNDSLLSGDAAQGSVALPIDVDGTAGGLVANSDAVSSDNTTTHSGGEVSADDDDALGSGNAVSAPIAGPVGLFGNSGGLGAHAESVADNTDVVIAGDNVKANGVDGGVSGNAVHTPVALPVQAFGDSLGWIVVGEADATNNTSSTAGGDVTTDGTDGVITGNGVVPRVSGPVQLFGTGLGLTNNVEGTADNVTEVTTAGDNTTVGDNGGIAGDIVDVPVALPVQAFGDGIGAGGNYDGTATNTTSSLAGGDNETSGVHGTANGTVASVPVAGAGQLFGDGVGFIANTAGAADNVTSTAAGGSTATNGVSSFLGGDILTAPIAPVVQGDGVAGSVGGTSDALSVGDAAAVAGGDYVTAGDNGSVSGVIGQVPVAVAGEVVGDAVSGLAVTDGTGSNAVTTVAGGAAETSGEDGGSLSGVNALLPVAGEAAIFDLPVEVVGEAMAEGERNTAVSAGDQASTFELPVTDKALGGGLLKPAELPSLSSLPKLPTKAGAARSATPQLPNMGGLLGGLGKVAPTGKLGQLPKLPAAQLPTPGAAQSRAFDAPALNTIDTSAVTGLVGGLGGLKG